MPPAGLTRARVIEEAAAVADEFGIEQLTLAEVADRLGVSVPALYKHVSGIEGVRRDLAVRAVRELTMAMATAALGRAGKDALDGIATAYRDYAHVHPGVSAAGVRAPAPDDHEHLAAGDAAVDVIAAALGGYGLTDDEMVHTIRAFRIIMHGLVSLEASGGFAMPHSLDDTFHRIIDGLHAALVAKHGPHPRE
ncbi:MAG: TetR/AcrR family transcriptional regulator [Solirubrobacterales bacterium]|nr:TetR/AcrR family transcriptional regulator [Solirubrobacterales bacterium]